jgi:hypothetical protein
MFPRSFHIKLGSNLKFATSFASCGFTQEQSETEAPLGMLATDIDLPSTAGSVGN